MSEPTPDLSEAAERVRRLADAVDLSPALWGPTCPYCGGGATDLGHPTFHADPCDLEALLSAVVALPAPSAAPVDGFGPGHREWCPVGDPEDGPHAHCGHWYECEPCHRCGDDTPDPGCDCDRCTAVRAAAPGETTGEVERLRAALSVLVALKDGPRDDAYRSAKDQAWEDARAALVSPSGSIDVAALARDRDRFAGLWVMCSAETVQVVTTMLDLAADGGLPAMVEALAEWTDGLELTDELAPKVNAAHAALSSPGGRYGQVEGWISADFGIHVHRVFDGGPAGLHAACRPLFRRLPAPAATPPTKGAKPKFCTHCDGFGVVMGHDFRAAITCPACHGVTADRPEHGPRPTKEGEAG